MSNASGGMSLAGTLGVVFVVLKLVGVVAWSWVWVLAPFWIPALLALAILALAWLVLMLRSVLRERERRRRLWR